MSNIAEGFERGSNKDFIEFLFNSKDSVGEVRSLISLGFELKYLSQDQFEDIYNQCLDLSKQIVNFI